MADKTPAMITVLYFAAASTATGKTSERVTLPTTSVDPATGEPSFPLSSLGDLLVSLYPSTNLKDVLGHSRWSVDAEMVDDPEAVVLKGGEEVAVICPVSGG